MGRRGVHQVRCVAGRVPVPVFAAIMTSMEQGQSIDGADERRAFADALAAACSAIGLSPTQRQRELMLAHFERVVEANRHFNLTRITSPADAAVKHYADSLTLLAAPWIEAGQSLKVIDVGTGAGFPAVPLAIMCPQWRILAIDGTGKKARFVAETAEQMGLTNLEALHSRAADLSCEGGRLYDLILVRAVGRIAGVLRDVRHLGGPGSRIVFYKTNKIEAAEMKDGTREAKRLKLSPGEPFDVELASPDGPLRRRLIRFEC